MVDTCLSGYMPGTLYFDEHGFPHGTGSKCYYYKSGALQLKDSYFAGCLDRSWWFRPDGSLVMETRWQAGSGTGIYLREDGSIRKKCQYVHGIAEGPATYYAEDGSVERTVTFRDGVEVKDD